MSQEGVVRIALVNDYEVVVAGLSRMLAPYADRVQVVELAAGEPVLSRVDIALYDTFAQDSGGAIDRESVMAVSGAERLVVYTWNTSADAVSDAVAAGVAGYLPKSLSAAEVVAALEKVHAGEQVVLVDDDTERVAGEEPEGSGEGDWPGQREGLSEREAEVIALIAQGLSNDQVAARAFLSINTVKSYIRSSYRKMGVESRSQAVLWAIDHGFRPDRVRVRVQDDPV